MSGYNIEKFHKLKTDFHKLKSKKKKTKDDEQKITTLAEQLNKKSEVILTEVWYAPALNWLCTQDLCVRNNCQRCSDPVSKEFTDEIFSKGISFQDLALVEEDDYDYWDDLDKIPTKKEITKALKHLDSLIGLSNIKEEIRDLIKVDVINSKRKKMDLPESKIGMHMVFTGNPGTGKTEVARAVGEIFKELEILKKGHVVEVDRSDIVGQYVGWTEYQLKELINQAKDGILFIDEAYALDDGAHSGFGDDAINTLVKAMEDERERLVVIMAGYPQEMEWLLDRNPGLRSRIPCQFHFEDYKSNDLVQIFKKFCADKEYELSQQAQEKLYSGLHQMKPEAKEKFGNARGCRNLFEHTLKNQSRRLYDKNLRAKKHFRIILPEDIDFGVPVHTENVSYISGARA